MEKIKRLAVHHGKKHKQFLLYTLIGLSGVALDYILFALGTKVFGIGILLANFIAISAGIINNFWLNTKYNFKTRDNLLKRFALFYAVGAIGLALSELLIVVFHYGAGLDELLAKLFTLPFVLVFQFFFNKRFSFGDLSQTSKQLKKLLFHWPLFLILILYGSLSIGLIASIPADYTMQHVEGGPDEAIHYNFNVKYIMENHSLPVSGRDDLEAYGACLPNPIGLVPCVYSYNTYPGPNYIFGAIMASIFGGHAITPEVASRITSFVSGLVFVTFAYAAVYAMLKRRLFAAVLVACIAFIPQVLFTNSYNNMDAHSLAISAIFGFAMIKFLQQPRNRKWQIAYAISLFGLIPVSKYNYFVLGVVGFAVAVYVFITQKFSQKDILRFALYAFLSFMVLASFWYIRNLVLYQDLLGQSFVVKTMAEHHPLGPAYSFSPTGLGVLLQHEFFNILFKSFFFAFGLMNYFLAEHIYTMVLLVLLVCSSLFFFNLAQPAINRRESRKLVAATFLYMGVFVGVLLSVAYNSLHYDFQPQGRYMYPILIPTILLLAYAIQKDKRFQIIPFLLLAGTALVFIEGFMLFVKVYTPLW
jgi:putative flippase GtrA